MDDRGGSSGHTSGSAFEAQVGIFWGVPSPRGTIDLVASSVPLADAEAYGDCLGYSRGHLEVWTEWQRRGATTLARQGLPPAIARHAYEHFPRGRIVYHALEAAFVIYADRKLQTAEFLVEIVRRFSLADQRLVIRSDAHYCSAAR